MMIMRPPQQGAWMLRCFWLVGLGGGCLDGIDREQWHGQHLAGARDVVGTDGAGEQAVVADAVEAAGQHVHQEAADELVGIERHQLVAIGTR